MNSSRPLPLDTLILTALSSALACGCANQGYSVIAATSTTIGVGISQQPANGSVDATLGYKRAEVAFVPTNRNSGESAGSSGGGAKDSGNVIMELRYAGIFSTGADSGIYQRLAVGDIAVKETGAALLFAKGPDGKIDAESAKALVAVKGIPSADTTATAETALLARKYSSFKASGDSANVKKFNDAAKGLGYTDFGSFLIDAKVTVQKAKTMRALLEGAGIDFNH